jgi:uncharacterized protein (TIGR02452 family)
VVFKDDSNFPVRLPELDWYRVNILTCDAPNLCKTPSNFMNPNNGSMAVNISQKELKQLLKKRIHRIFDIACREDNEVLILGAFGCGTFRNSTKNGGGADE